MRLVDADGPRPKWSGFPCQPQVLWRGIEARSYAQALPIASDLSPIARISPEIRQRFVLLVTI
jgi:hypothetical protein